jgi:hypothetical protein
MNEPIEAEIVDEPRTAALATRTETNVAVWTPTFAVAIDEAVARVDAKHQFFKRVMRQGDHYGVIPGTGTKPTLLKPGAELLLANMGLNAEFEDESPPVLDITGAEHNGEPFIWYRRRCKIYRQVGPNESERMLVGQASGACNSWEKKYRYRNAERICPECGKAAIIAGKPEFNNGVPNWVCYKKKDGCGASFAKDDARLAGDVGKVPNTEVFDLENTILKMADKRALVAATLIATGCSDIFTQDMEEAAAPTGDAAVAAPVQSQQHQHSKTRRKTVREQLIELAGNDRLVRLLGDNRITPSERDAAIYEVTGSDKPASIDTVEKAAAVLDKLQTMLQQSSEEIPW